jgi:hypothetical protein
MDELTRFARLLVERLATRAEGVNRPVSIAEVRKTLLPYRGQRRALGLDSVEDYESVLLRLVAEERGYVKTQPAAAAERCREELGQPNPDLGVLEEIAESTIQVTSLAAGQIVGDIRPEPSIPAERPETRSTQPDPAPGPHAQEQPELSKRPEPEAKGACRFCQTRLPAGKTVTFCPWCGERLIPLTCSRCGTELEAEWRHCITCGMPALDPFRPS